MTRERIVIDTNDALLERVASLVEIVDVLQSVRASRDPKDDKFLEAAVNGRADVIVTGDKDLLVSPAEAVRRLRRTR